MFRSFYLGLRSKPFECQVSLFQVLAIKFPILIDG
jgi:hypothetical protein